MDNTDITILIVLLAFAFIGAAWVMARLVEAVYFVHDWIKRNSVSRRDAKIIADFKAAFGDRWEDEMKRIVDDETARQIQTAHDDVMKSIKW